MKRQLCIQFASHGADIGGYKAVWVRMTINFLTSASSSPMPLNPSNGSKTTKASSPVSSTLCLFILLLISQERGKPTFTKIEMVPG